MSSNQTKPVQSVKLLVTITISNSSCSRIISSSLTIPTITQQQQLQQQVYKTVSKTSSSKHSNNNCVLLLTNNNSKTTKIVPKQQTVACLTKLRTIIHNNHNTCNNIILQVIWFLVTNQKLKILFFNTICQTAILWNHLLLHQIMILQSKPNCLVRVLVHKISFIIRGRQVFNNTIISSSNSIRLKQIWKKQTQHQQQQVGRVQLINNRNKRNQDMWGNQQSKQQLV